MHFILPVVFYTAAVVLLLWHPFTMRKRGQHLSAKLMMQRMLKGAITGFIVGIVLNALIWHEPFTLGTRLSVFITLAVVLTVLYPLYCAYVTRTTRVEK